MKGEKQQYQNSLVGVPHSQTGLDSCKSHRKLVTSCEYLFLHPSKCHHLIKNLILRASYPFLPIGFSPSHDLKIKKRQDNGEGRFRPRYTYSEPLALPLLYFFIQKNTTPPQCPPPPHQQKSTQHPLRRQPLHTPTASPLRHAVPSLHPPSTTAASRTSPWAPRTPIAAPSFPIPAFCRRSPTATSGRRTTCSTGGTSNAALPSGSCRSCTSARRKWRGMLAFWRRRGLRWLWG